ncbi:hypothetical protein JCM6882_008135 [Rhodosporidiobolus microsporus]
MRREDILDVPTADSPATQTQAIRILLPCTAGWMASLWFFGIYSILHGQYVLGPYYGRLSWRVKSVLWAVFVFLLLYMLCIVGEQALWTVTTDRSLFHHYNGDWIDPLLPVFGGIVAALVQGLLSTRAALMISRATYRWAFMTFTTLFILFTLAMAMLTSAANFLAAWLWGSAATDLIISLSLALTLRKRIAGFSHTTDALLKKLIVAALQTASYTTLLAILGATTSVAFDDWNGFAAVNYAFFCPLFPCYGISLYTTLATRRTVDQFIGTSRPSEETAHLSLARNTSHRPTPLTPHSRRIDVSPARGRAVSRGEDRRSSAGKEAPKEDDLLRQDEEEIGL